MTEQAQAEFFDRCENGKRRAMRKIKEEKRLGNLKYLGSSKDPNKIVSGDELGEETRPAGIRNLHAFTSSKSGMTLQDIIRYNLDNPRARDIENTYHLLVPGCLDAEYWYSTPDGFIGAEIRGAEIRGTVLLHVPLGMHRALKLRYEREDLRYVPRGYAPGDEGRPAAEDDSGATESGG